MGCSDSRMQPVKHAIPFWTQSLTYDQTLAVGLTVVSEGMTNLNLNTVMVERIGSHTSDAARWGAPMPTGKHVYEVTWPQLTRGGNSCIGVGTVDIPLSHKGRVSLVGFLSKGWCVDMSRRKVIHGNQIVAPASRPLPNKYYIYVDIDAGKIGFSEDVAVHGHQCPFYGWVVSGMKSNPSDPYYLMVSSSKQNETLTVIYKGSYVQQGGYDLVTAVLAEQQQLAVATGPPALDKY